MKSDQIVKKRGAYKSLIDHISRLHAGEVARAIGEISDTDKRMEQDDEQ